MSLLAALLGQCLHIVLMVAAAPVVAGAAAWAGAALAGRRGPVPWQPWRDLRRLLRKQPVAAENASIVSRAAPVLCLLAAGTAAALVPSFTLGMAFAPLADLLVVAGLLALARMAAALAALDVGTALAGLGAARASRLASLAEPALLLAILALGVLGGTTNLDLLIGLQLQGMLLPGAAAVLAVAALAALAIQSGDAAVLSAEFSGSDLAMLHLAGMLRRLAWIDLIGALFCPLGMGEPGAEPGAGLPGWGAGVATWVIRLVVVTGGMAGLRHLAGAPRSARLAQAAGVAAALALLAALLAMASAVAA